MADIAIVSVVSATAVGTAGIVAGHLAARGNRRHERELRTEERRADRQTLVYDQRRAAYVNALTLALAYRYAVRHENRVAADPWPGATPQYLFRVGATVYAWGSDPVVELWKELVGDALGTLTDNVTADVRDRVNDLVEELREQINRELREFAD